MSDEKEQPRMKPQVHLERLREEAATRKIGPDGKCAGTSVGDRSKGSGGVVSFADRTGRAPSGNVGQKTRVLLIEPDETLRNYLKDTLNQHDFEVTVSDHPDGRGMYQPGVETDINGEFPLYNLIIWGHSDEGLQTGAISYGAPDPVCAMRYNNKQRIPTVLITDMPTVKEGIEDRKVNGLIHQPVMVLDREKMDLTSDDGLREAATAIESAGRAAIARAKPMEGKSR